uniref:Secreted protein n=1 Tax=Ixodes ricinus TaxID=34613 RepID=A0A6B0UUV6_IXORI
MLWSWGASWASPLWAWRDRTCRTATPPSPWPWCGSSCGLTPCRCSRSLPARDTPSSRRRLLTGQTPSSSLRRRRHRSATFRTRASATRSPLWTWSTPSTPAASTTARCCPGRLWRSDWPTPSTPSRWPASWAHASTRFPKTSRRESPRW